MTPLDTDSARRVFHRASQELRGLLTLLVVVGECRPISFFEALRWRNFVELGHPSGRRDLRQWTLIHQAAPGDRCFIVELPNWATGVLWAWFRAVKGRNSHDEILPGEALASLRRELLEICRDNVAWSDLATWQRLGEMERIRFAGCRSELNLPAYCRANRDEFFLPSLLQCG